MIGMDHIAVCAVQDVKFSRGDFHRIGLPTLMNDQMVIARGAMRNKCPADCARNTARRQYRTRHDDARDPDARIGWVDRVNELGNAIRVESHIGQQPTIRHGKIRGFIVWFRRNDEYVVLVFGNPVFVMSGKNMAVGQEAPACANCDSVLHGVPSYTGRFSYNPFDYRYPDKHSVENDSDLRRDSEDSGG